MSPVSESLQCDGSGEATTPSVLAALRRTMTRAVDRLNEEKERIACLENGTARMEAPRRITLDLLMVGWGLGTWLGVNGLYVQLPLMVERLPEGWALPASMVLVIQLANIGPVAYGLLRRLAPSVSDAPYIYSLLTLGIVSLALNAFLYAETVTIAGSERSFAFLTLTFAAALVGCSSSVLFYPYLRHFRNIYLATYLVGEGLSGFLPSMVALAQGVGGEPECLPTGENSTLEAHYPPARFDSTVFLLLLSGLAAVSLACFTAVDRLRTFQRERVEPPTGEKQEEAAAAAAEGMSSRTRWSVVLLLTAVLNALSNGVLPSVQSYSCMPYGAGTYHLAVTLAAVANPAACLAGVWLRPASSRVLALLLLVTLVPLAYIMATALMSPDPPLVGLTVGSVLIISSWVGAHAVVSYARMWTYDWARRGGARGMRLCGAFTQLGSALGSALFYVLVNYTALFVQADTCPATDRAL